MTNKPHRIRVRALDGKPRNQKDLNQLKSNILGMPHIDIVDAKGGVELIIGAAKEAHLDQVRGKLSSIGLEEIEGGSTATPAPTTSTPQGARQNNSQRRGQTQDRRPQHDRHYQQRGGPQHRANEAPQNLNKKPYGFVSLPETFASAAPIWHDGTSSVGRLSGEVRFELETLTPLLVGWERGTVGGEETDWPLPANLNGVGQLATKKPVLCPLRAPWGVRLVIIPGDTLKGLLRHELGALLGAPMERVAERSYSYRPNALYPSDPRGRFLVPRLACVPEESIRIEQVSDSLQVRVPIRLELFPAGLEYSKKEQRFDYRFGGPNGKPYRGGQGAGERLNSKRQVHTSLEVLREVQTETFPVPEAVQQGYLATIRHLIDLKHGHFSERHPDVPKDVQGDDARDRILEVAKNVAFQPGDMIWVEWDTEQQCIVSLGWHYYYRWAYVDTVRTKGNSTERTGLFPLDQERNLDAGGIPEALTALRRLFGYTGDNEGSAGIGKDDYAQLMGRISINAALEVVEETDSDTTRFLKPTFLKELGIPRPSAVEFYLKQPYYPNSRPSDSATLVTYGDVVGYDEPGELAGRKFYLDRPDAYTGRPWEDESDTNRANERSTLALEASRPGRRFRFTLRFRDLEPTELAAALVALCPHQFRAVLEGNHQDGYCSKLGYARPLGWGSVRIEAKALLLLETSDSQPILRDAGDIIAWTQANYQSSLSPVQAEWLDIHRHKHPDAADYPRARDRDGSENIYTFHTKLRGEHSRKRRYRNGGNQ